MKNCDVVLTIAGSDSSAGAGIQADLKSVAACGSYCATAITAITAQNSCGVRGVEIISTDMVEMQIKAIVSDLNVKAIKLGMLPSSGIVECVRRIITDYRIENVVLDPVMIATSGDMLVSESVAREIIDKLLPISTIVTPNIIESEFISGMTIKGVSDYDKVWNYFKGLGCKSLLQKSGHLDSVIISDYLYLDGAKEIYQFSHKKIATKNTHGTGCSLSSSIAAYLSQGYAIYDSVNNAEKYIQGAIMSSDYELGSGHGPINHFWNYER